MNKYIYLHVLQANYGYGHGWEDVTESTEYRRIRQDLRDYNLNAPEYRYRMIERRELNPDHPANKSWQECHPTEAEAWAVQQGSQFVCQQGRETWLQDTCVGWALCSSDKSWIESKCAELKGDKVISIRLVFAQ